MTKPNIKTLWAHITNSLYQAIPTINVTGNEMVHFTNCYVRSTGAVVGL